MENRTEINELGEFGLIKRLTQNIELHNASSVLGVGDDAAVIDHFGRQTVVTTDLLIEGVHFDLARITHWKHLGYKSVIVSLSDVYAMNAVPTDHGKYWFRLIVSAWRHWMNFMKAYMQPVINMGVDLVGGDTSSSQG